MSNSGLSSPLDSTFAVLAASTSNEIDALLCAAVCSSHEDAARRAARQISAKPDLGRVTEVAKRSAQLNPGAAEEFASRIESLTSLLQQVLNSKDSTVSAGAIEFIEHTSSLSLVSTLIPIAEDGSHPLHDAAFKSVREIVLRISDKLSGIEVAALAHVKNDELQRKKFDLLAEFDKRSEKFNDLAAPQLMVECILLLGDLNCTAVKNLLENRGNACKHMVKTVLAQGSHPRLVNVVCHNLTVEQPHQKVHQVFLTRSDVDFAARVLEWLPQAPSGTLAENLGHIDELPWLDIEHPTWNSLPQALHAKLVTLINALGIDSSAKHQLKKWILQNSGPEGRAAAGDLFSDLPEEEKQEVLYEALSDDNPEVEAWATHQLRSQQVPDAFQQLLKRLDATNDIVRDAARDELSDFTLEKMYAFLPKMPKATAMRCAEVMLKVDPTTTDTIREELQHPYRWKKLRAARAAAVLGLIDNVLNAIGKLTEDPEASVRRSALEAIAESKSRDSLAWVERRLNDPSRNVRQAAQEALDQIKNNLA